MQKYTAIEIRTLIKDLEKYAFYVYIIEALEEGLEDEYFPHESIKEILKERYPEVYHLMYLLKTKDLPLYIGGPYKSIVAWRLKHDTMPGE